MSSGTLDWTELKISRNQLITLAPRTTSSSSSLTRLQIEFNYGPSTRRKPREFMFLWFFLCHPHYKFFFSAVKLSTREREILSAEKKERKKFAQPSRSLWSELSELSLLLSDKIHEEKYLSWYCKFYCCESELVGVSKGSTHDEGQSRLRNALQNSDAVRHPGELR